MRLFRLHVALFLVANAAMAAYWASGDGGAYWPLGFHFVWAAALTMHWVNDWVARTHAVD